VFPDSDMTN